jgi:hypothetical protein
MTTVLYVIGALVILLAIYPALPILAAAWRRYRGTRVITCPETHQPAAVEVDARHAAVTLLLGGASELRLRDCTRWPEKRNCGQECLRQIEATPEDCLVRNMLARWYAGKSCVCCGKELGEIDWLQHRPGLMSPEHKTFEWRDIPPETLPSVLASYLPVCWNCHVAESFRREYPDLVTDRSPQPHQHQH